MQEFSFKAISVDAWSELLSIRDLSGQTGLSPANHNEYWAVHEEQGVISKRTVSYYQGKLLAMSFCR